jgi:putative membrane protein
MKTVLRNLSIYALILYFLPQIVPGLHMEGGGWTIFFGAIGLSILFLIIKPILTIITFPVNVITVGLFSVLINGLILYLLTIFIVEISIVPFTYEKANIFGFITPEIYFNTFFAYLFTAFVLATIDGVIRWLIE